MSSLPGRPHIRPVQGDPALNEGFVRSRDPVSVIHGSPDTIGTTEEPQRPLTPVLCMHIARPNRYGVAGFQNRHVPRGRDYEATRLSALRLHSRGALTGVAAGIFGMVSPYFPDPLLLTGFALVLVRSLQRLLKDKTHR